MTTSRKAGPVTRRLARSLSAIFRCIYENRGKRNFNSVLTRAESLGHKRVVFVHEDHGNPHELVAIQIGDDESYHEVGTFVFNHLYIERLKRISPNLSYDKASAVFVKLFLTNEKLSVRPGRDYVELITDNDVLRIFVNNKEIVVLKKVA